MIKLFASDLDGTLLNARHQVDRVIARSICEVVDAGCHVAVATGRTMLSSREHGFDGLPIDIVCANGSIVVPRGAQPRTFPLDAAVVEELLRAFPNLCFDCVTLAGTFCTGTEQQRQATFSKDNPIRRIVMGGMARARAASFTYKASLAEVMAHEVVKINVRVPSAQDSRALHEFIAGHADGIVNAPFSPVMFELTDPAVDKGASVAYLARYYGYTEDEVAVYGDGGNDLAMLGRFKHAYATANGSDDAKRAAGTVIGRCALHAVPRHMVRTVRLQAQQR